MARPVARSLVSLHVYPSGAQSVPGPQGRQGTPGAARATRLDVRCGNLHRLSRGDTNPEGVRAHTISSAISFHSAATVTPAAAQDRIRERTTTALRRGDDFRPYGIETPVRLDMTFKSDRPAEMLAYLSVVERTTAHGIRFIGRDMPGVSRFIEFVTGHSISLEP